MSKRVARSAPMARHRFSRSTSRRLACQWWLAFRWWLACQLAGLVIVLAGGCSGGTAPGDGADGGQATRDAGSSADGWLDGRRSPDARSPRSDGQALSDGTGDRVPVARGQVIVTTDELAMVAAEIADYRRSVGYVTDVVPVSELVSGTPSPAQLVNAVVARLRSARATLSPGASLFLLLLGDARAPDARPLQAGRLDEPAGMVAGRILEDRAGVRPAPWLARRSARPRALEPRAHHVDALGPQPKPHRGHDEPGR